MYRTDLYFKTDPELAAIAMDFAQDESLLLATVAEAWQLLMNADMFSGSQVGWAVELQTKVHLTLKRSLKVTKKS